ncbi:MAG: proteasome subunit beta [Thermoproteota archaeon]|uniref:Proteasome subunit beta n=2 Tax=Candidatus Methanodesulfokora washburnensis TaxID=2478471 RepID=A0A3R9R1H5_9CREN|nr:proteasome subunit beta [Candidatus Methanodesulfokores washburnensis]RZN61641.1 MAG: proteasome subunit beta [Candidatus Methanodesulfokores washburnensis]TDA41534.1 MAG: proteasome subunit beta [Candidatus Korarchaeota archaeon]
MLKGTTTVGIKCLDGVVIASDRRASSETFIASKNARKTIKISNRAVATISGLVADGQYLTTILSAISSLYELDQEREMPISSIAKYLALMLRSYRPYILIAHLIVGGVDRSGPHLFNVDFYGTLTEENYIATGSGSPVAISVIEEGYSTEISVEKGKILALNAMLSALSRDSATGDGIDLTVVDERGVKFLERDEIQKMIERR